MAGNQMPAEYKYNSRDLSTLISTLKSVSGGLETIVSALKNEQRELQQEMNAGSYDYSRSGSSTVQAEAKTVDDQLKLLENTQLLVDDVYTALNDFYNFTNDVVTYNNGEEFNYDAPAVLNALSKMKNKVEAQETYNEIVKESNSFDVWEVGNDDNLTIGKNDRRQRDAYRHNRHLTDDLNDFLNAKFEEVKSGILEANTMNSINYDEFIGGKLIDDLLRNVNLDRSDLELKNFEVTDAKTAELTDEQLEDLRELKSEVKGLETKIKNIVKEGVEKEKKINKLRKQLTDAEDGDPDALTNLIASILWEFDNLPESVQTSMFKVLDFMETSKVWKVLDTTELVMMGAYIIYNLEFYGSYNYVSYDALKRLAIGGTEYISGEVVEKIGFWLGGIAAAAVTDGLGATAGAAVGAELGSIIGDVVASEIAGKTFSYVFDCVFDEGTGRVLVWDEDITDFIYEVSIEIKEFEDNPSLGNWNEIVGNIVTDVDEIFYGA